MALFNDVGKVIIGAGISGASCFNWFSRHPSSPPVLLVDRLPAYIPQRIATRPRGAINFSSSDTNASRIGGCWVKPPVPRNGPINKADELSAAAHELAIDFYDDIGAFGTNYPWKILKRPGFFKDDWSINAPENPDRKRILGPDGSPIGHEYSNSIGDYRYFEDSGEVVNKVINDALSRNPSFRYLPNCKISKIIPVVKHKSFSGGKTSTHVIWMIYPQSGAPIKTRQVILATGSEFQEPGISHVPELAYMRNSHPIQSSLIELESTEPFPPYIFQSGDMILAPHPSEDATRDGQPRYYAQLSSYLLSDSQKANLADVEKFVEETKKIFKEMPKSAVVCGVTTGKTLETSNKLPIVGGLLDPFQTAKQSPQVLRRQQLPQNCPRLAGLYSMGSMGSNGFTLAPLTARMFVEQNQGPIDINSAFSATDHSRHQTNFWNHCSPKRLLSRWFAYSRPPVTLENMGQPAWQVEWPKMIESSRVTPSDFDRLRPNLER